MFSIKNKIETITYTELKKNPTFPKNDKIAFLMTVILKKKIHNINVSSVLFTCPYVTVERKVLQGPVCVLYFNIKYT